MSRSHPGAEQELGAAAGLVLLLESPLRSESPSPLRLELASVTRRGNCRLR